MNEEDWLDTFLHQIMRKFGYVVGGYQVWDKKGRGPYQVGVELECRQGSRMKVASAMNTQAAARAGARKMAMVGMRLCGISDWPGRAMKQAGRQLPMLVER